MAGCLLIEYASMADHSCLACRLEDSPPAVGTSANGEAADPTTSLSKPDPQKAEPPKQAAKVVFGVRAKPLKVVHKKKIVVPESAVESDAVNGNGSHAVAASNGAAEQGLLGLGSYGSESD